MWSGGTRLAGTVTLPASAGPHPAALLLSGSGPLDRDSNTARMRLDVSKAVAAGLLSHGIASLRYDKRGVGQSGGDYLSTGFDDETADARAALDSLRSHPGVDADRVIVIGHSAGATIAMRLATIVDATRRLRLPGRGGDDWPAGHGVADASDRGVAPPAARRTGPPLRAPPSATPALLLGSTTDTVRLAVVRWNARWLREYMAYDPTEALATIDRPSSPSPAPTTSRSTPATSPGSVRSSPAASTARSRPISPTSSGAIPDRRAWAPTASSCADRSTRGSSTASAPGSIAPGLSLTRGRDPRRRRSDPLRDGFSD